MNDTALVFKAAGTLYAVDASLVVSICELPAMTRAPLCPKCVKGVCTVRGNTVPVVDIAPIMGAQSQTACKCLVVARIRGMYIGLMADDVIRTAADQSLKTAFSANGKLISAYLPDKTAVIDADCLVDTILLSSEGVV